MRSNYNRHLREEHPPKGGAICKKARQKSQRDRAATLRRAAALKRPAQPLEARSGGGEARGEGGGGATSYVMYVTCPSHRVGFYEGLLVRFAGAGFAIANIHRRKGMDFAVYAARAAKAKPAARHDARRRFGTAFPPAGLERSQFLHWDFVRNFLPLAQKVFDKNRALRFVFWVEDDAAFRPSGETCPADRVLQACESSWPSATWCGYARVKREPRYQSHLLAVTPWSCGALRRELHPDRVGGWYGLDTAIYKVAAVEVDGQALIKCPPESLSHQLNHRLKGRRC